MDIPFVIISATLPTEFLSSLSERFGTRLIDAGEEPISARAKRTVALRKNLNE